MTRRTANIFGLMNIFVASVTPSMSIFVAASMTLSKNIFVLMNMFVVASVMLSTIIFAPENVFPPKDILVALNIFHINKSKITFVLINIFFGINIFIVTNRFRDLLMWNISSQYICWYKHTQ